MRQVFIILFALIATALNAREIVKVGVILPLSGDLATYGQAVRDGFLFAIDELKQSDTRFDYHFIIEDTAAKPRETLLVTKKLISVDHVDFIVSLWGWVANPITPLTNKAQVPHLCLLCWNESLPDGNMNLVLATSVRHQAQSAIKIFEKLGYKRIALLRAHDYESDAAAISIREVLKQHNMSLVSEQAYNPGLRDFVPLILKIKESQPDALINLSYNPEIYIVEKKIAEMELTCPVTSFECYDGITENEYVQGRWYVSCTQAASGFKEKYEKATGKKMLYAEGFAYDAAHIIVQAFEKHSSDGNKPSAQQIANHLRSINNYQGVVGKLTSNEIGYIDTDPQLLRIVDGKAIPTTSEEILATQ